MFKKNETVTASDGIPFQILEGNPATVGAKNSSISRVDGNYTSDIGFPSVIFFTILSFKFYFPS